MVYLNNDFQIGPCYRCSYKCIFYKQKNIKNYTLKVTKIKCLVDYFQLGHYFFSFAFVTINLCNIFI